MKSQSSSIKLVLVVVCGLLALLGSVAWQPTLAAQSASAPAAPASITGTIAFLTGSEIHLIEMDGSNDRLVWSVPDPQYNTITNLAWRPDATEIAFASDHEQTKSRFESDLYAIRPDGSGLRKLTNLQSATALSSYPKGNVTLNIGNGTADAGPFIIYIHGAAVAQSVNIPPGTVKVVTFNDVADFGNVGQSVVAIDGVFRWVMPSGVDVQAGTTVNRSWTMSGAGYRNFGAYNPTWRSDGSKVGFMFGGCVALYQVPADPPIGIAESPLLNTTSAPPPCLLDWSPQASSADQILYGVFGSPGDDGVWQVSEGSSVAGTQVYSYTTPDLLYGLTWLPDASGFLFAQTTNFDANSNIYAYDFAAGTVTALTQFATEFAGHMSVSPDGQWIVFERAASNTASPDLWLMRRDGSEMRLLVRNAVRPSWSRRVPPQANAFRLMLPLIRR